MRPALRAPSSRAGSSVSVYSVCGLPEVVMKPSPTRPASRVAAGPDAAPVTQADSATPAAAPVYARLPSKVRDDDVRPPLPGLVVDTVFFIVATAAAGWLGLRLLEDVWHRTRWHLFLLIPFWAMVAYLVLPRLQTMLTTVYVPGYFIARTRTSDAQNGRTPV